MNSFFILYRIFSFLVSRLPFSILYLISGVLRFIIRDVARYRKKVVMDNLRNAFPEKSEKEIRRIARQFYRHLSDVIVEIIKLEHISAEELKERFIFGDCERLKETFARNRSAIISIGHCGNWEWMGTALGLVTPQKGYAIVKPLTSKAFNTYMEMLRHRLNPDSTIPFRSAFRTMVRKRPELSFNVIAGDQTPTRDEANFWTTFLNQDTPFFQGIEKISRSLGMDVYFMEIRRTGRGRYFGQLRLITADAEHTEENEITLKYIRMLEDSIRQNPYNWLWSHRRWKHSRTPGEI